MEGGGKLKNLKIQVVREREEIDLAYVQKHIDLGWKAVNRFSLGDKVYFISLIWESDDNPIYPPESQLNKMD